MPGAAMPGIVSELCGHMPGDHYTVYSAHFVLNLLKFKFIQHILMLAINSRANL